VSQSNTGADSSERGDRGTRPSISLVLPAWNEAEAIQRAIGEAVEALSGLTDDYEIIIVDDGSEDATAELVTQAAQVNGAVRLIRHESNIGYGASLRDGFAAATKDLVAFTDADCQFDLQELDRLVFLARSYQVVCGYRIDRKDSPLRCLYSRVYNVMVKTLLGTGVRDVDCAMKMFHREVVQRLTISTDGFLVNSELLSQAREHGCSIVEVGVSHRPRREGESTVSIHHIPVVLATLARFWWNRVMFSPDLNPRAESSAAKPARPTAHRLPWAATALMTLAALFLFTNLGYPLIDRDETRYAEIPREMIATGNWILPQLNFKPYYDKPPLLYWVCAASYQVFGISEWSARLVPAAASFLTILATLIFGTHCFGRRTGLLAASVLMLSIGFAFTSRYLLIDSLLTLLTTLSFSTAYVAMRGDRIHLGWWLVSSVCCGLAFLAKGPIALVLLMPVVLLFSWLSESAAKIRPRDLAIFSAVVAGIAAPWLVAVALQDKDFLPEFFYRHNVRRFAGDFHAKPIWYFVPVLLLAGHPWSFMAIPYARFFFRRDTAARLARPQLVGYLFLWSAFCFAFFSLSKCKLPTYLLPMAPALSLMIADYLNRVIGSDFENPLYRFAKIWSPRCATTATCLAGIGVVLYVVFSGMETTFATYVWGLVWTTFLIGSIVLFSDRSGRNHAWATTGGVSFLLVAMMLHQTLPLYGREETVFGPESPLVAELGELKGQSIVTVDHEFSEVPFYLGRSDIANFSIADSDRLARWVQGNGDTLVVLDEHVPSGRLIAQLPHDLIVRREQNRGPATLIWLSPAAVGGHASGETRKRF
jgi:4-amino-4-deoxy-L-arabinose transferase-like glycosyltransferase